MWILCSIQGLLCIRVSNILLAQVMVVSLRFDPRNYLQCYAQKKIASTLVKSQGLVTIFFYLNHSTTLKFLEWQSDKKIRNKTLWSNLNQINTGTCFIQKIYAPSSSLLQGIGQEYSAKVTFSIFQSLRWIFHMHSEFSRPPCVTMPS